MKLLMRVSLSDTHKKIAEPIAVTQHEIIDVFGAYDRQEIDGYYYYVTEITEAVVPNQIRDIINNLQRKD